MKDDTQTTIAELKEEIANFVRQRDWEKYHNPKDLAESICIEAAELLEIFQWRPKHDLTDDMLERVRNELADVAIYCLSMANATGIDLSQSILNKLTTNAKKYPAELYRGKAHLE